MAFECSECSYEDESAESVAGHLLSVHDINAFDDMAEVQKQQLHDRVLDALQSL